MVTGAEYHKLMALPWPVLPLSAMAWFSVNVQSEMVGLPVPVT